TQPALLATSGLWFGGPFALWDNIRETFSYDGGIFLRWVGNTVLYVVVGAGGATLLATAAGYGLAKYRFAGRRAVFAVILGAIAIFLTVALRLLGPGIATVALFAMVATWNNYFLPLIMLSKPDWYPLTVGLSQWNAQATGAAAHPIYHLVITGSLLMIAPLIA